MIGGGARGGVIAIQRPAAYTVNTSGRAGKHALMQLSQILVLALLASLAIFMRRQPVTRKRHRPPVAGGLTQLPTPARSSKGGWPFAPHCAAQRFRHGWRRPALLPGASSCVT